MAYRLWASLPSAYAHTPGTSLSTLVFSLSWYHPHTPRWCCHVGSPSVIEHIPQPIIRLIVVVIVMAHCQFSIVPGIIHAHVLHSHTSTPSLTHSSPSVMVITCLPLCLFQYITVIAHLPLAGNLSLRSSPSGPAIPPGNPLVYPTSSLDCLVSPPPRGYPHTDGR